MGDKSACSMLHTELDRIRLLAVLSYGSLKCHMVQLPLSIAYPTCESVGGEGLVLGDPRERNEKATSV